MSNSFELFSTHFSRENEKKFREASPPYVPLITDLITAAAIAIEESKAIRINNKTEVLLVERSSG